MDDARATSFCVIVIVFSIVMPSHAAVIISGDSTPASYAVPPFSVPGNQQFFTNILGPNDRVLILRSSLSDSWIPIYNFYNGLAGVSVTAYPPGTPIIEATINANLLIIPTPDHAYTATEISKITNFLNNNGTLFLLGEPSAPGQSQQEINTMLLGLGIPVALNPDQYDIGPQTSTLSEIANNPLTSGVTSFNYGSTFSITGGTPLFYTHGGLPYVVIVPEPSTLALLALGSLCLLVRTKNKFSLFR
jgi:hypothetical protein